MSEPSSEEPVVLSDVYSVAQAAASLGLTGARVRQLIRAGELTVAFETPLGRLLAKKSVDLFPLKRARNRRFAGTQMREPNG